jgi:hypothetical protein
MGRLILPLSFLSNSDIAERVKAMPLPCPALLMMGDVIKANGYAQQLADQTLASYPVIAQA